MAILIVDENTQVRLFVNRLLANYGFLTIEAKDGQSAVSVVRENPGMIDALLTDVELQGMNGFDLANAIRSEFPSMPIIFLSTAFSEADAMSQDVPGCGFLPKPFDPPALIAALRSLIPPRFCPDAIAGGAEGVAHISGAFQHF